MDNQSIYKIEMQVDGQWIVVDDHGTEIDGPFKNRIDAQIVKKECEKQAS